MAMHCHTNSVGEDDQCVHPLPQQGMQLQLFGLVASYTITIGVSLEIRRIVHMPMTSPPLIADGVLLNMEELHRELQNVREAEPGPTMRCSLRPLLVSP